MRNTTRLRKTKSNIYAAPNHAGKTIFKEKVLNCLSFVFFSQTRRRTAHQYIKKKKEGEKSPKKLLQKHRNKKLLQRKGSATHPKNPNYVVSLENYKAGPKNHRTQKELGGRSQGKEIRNSSSPCCCPLLSFFLKS